MARRNPLDPFALNIGRLCNEWQHLEGAVEMIFGLVAGMPEGRVRNMVHVIDIRQLIAAIKIGVVATTTPTIQHWTDEVVFAMDYIDNTLRNRRNRYVHDSLWDGHWGIMRHTRQPRLERAQAHAPLRVSSQVRVESLADLRATLKGVRDTWQWLEQLEYARKRLTTFPERPREQLEALRPQLLPQAPTGTLPPRGI